LEAYRVSVEWGRVVPRRGEVDAAALEHYRRLAAALEAAGIRPIVCLHHFTNPRWLHDECPGGWASAGAVDRFVEFAEVVAGALPQARDWVPFNEPMVYTGGAHLAGMFPPGRLGVFRPARDFLGGPVRHVALAHRRVHALLKRRLPGCRVGIAQSVNVVEPLRPGRDDEAARLWDELFHWALLDALVLARMDADLDGERETVLGEGPTLDFVGVNYYTRGFVRRVPLVLRPVHGAFLFPDMCMTPPLGLVWKLLTAGRATLPHDDLLREVYPDGLRRVLEATHRRYGLPLLVTENGVPDESGLLRGPHLLGHLEAVRAAIADGVPVEGYLYWSLVDNWEWGSFRPRFGLWRVDFERGHRRTLTEGGALYRDVIARHRASRGG
ncbi:MAG TPA: family 1 glycosylhydrolase, partial [Planctomycetota bacterium]|nr:family 1 glycosylhydrolase [Planctomycetota bacterium]